MHCPTRRTIHKSHARQGHVDLLQQSIITFEWQAPSAACCSTLLSLSVLFPADAVHQDPSQFSWGNPELLLTLSQLSVIHDCEHNMQIVSDLCDSWHCDTVV